MQAVYSGGSACTPYASPRYCKKLYSEPFQPGYSPNNQVNPNHPSQCVTVHKPHRTRPHHHLSEDEESLRDSIPTMRWSVAVTCFILNVAVPGLGTFISGLTLWCGSRVRKKTQTVSSAIRVNCLVALIQFATTFLFLMGWIWSIMWGMAFIAHSADYTRPEDRPSSSKPLTPVPIKHEVKLPTCDEGIITLQEPPATAVENPTTSSRSQPILSCVNARQQRILRRNLSEQELQTAMLTTDSIEQIIARDYPVHNINGNQTTVHQGDELNPQKR